MKSISKLLIAIPVLLSIAACNAQVKNATTESVKIYGNCGMCERTIEKAGNVKRVSQVDWDKDTKMATISYNANVTNKEEILKRIALAGYDSEAFNAPDDVYANLPGCCQYDRPNKVEPMKMEKTEDASPQNNPAKSASPTPTDNHSGHNQTIKPQTEESSPAANPLKPVFDHYFELKNALVKTDGSLASTAAQHLLSDLKSVQMGQLSTDEHTVWMKVMKSLRLDTEHIANTKDAGQQRERFNTLSDNMYQLIKVSKQETPTYYQHCPMANGGKGANWLSKENVVKNPYYGSEMLSCGKSVETIK